VQAAPIFEGCCGQVTDSDIDQFRGIGEPAQRNHRGLFEEVPPMLLAHTDEMVE
jgi:hypothetical protein